MRKSFAALFLAGLLAASTQVQAQSGDVRRGQTVAREVCAPCHAVNRAPAASPNPNAPPFRTIVERAGMNELGLYSAIRTPHGDMATVLPDVADLRNVIAYLLSLQDQR